MLKKILLLTIISLSGLSVLLAQTDKSSNDQIVILDVSDISLDEVLQLIEDQIGIRFSYNSNLIGSDKKITYKGNKELKEVLEDILKPIALDFIFLEKQIVIKKKKYDKSELKDIRGYVTDELNGEAIIGGTVFIANLGIGVLTNEFGFYSLSIPPGDHNLAFSYIGYEEQSIAINASKQQDYSIGLAENPAVLDEVLVTSSIPSLVEQIQMSKDNLSSNTVEEMPALFGETDVVKSLEFVPGIKSHSDGSTFFYVRGGNRDQNLILIDDAPIFNPSHLLGVFSTIIPDAVNSIDIYKGNMPASLGGRLSSVIDIRTKKGNDKKLQFWGNLGVISGKLGVEGPIKKDYSSFLFSARASRLKWLANNDENDVKKFNFYDFTGKLNFKLGPKDQLYISSYSGRDNYFVDNSGLEWANITGSARWNHIFGDDLFMNATIAGSSYDYFLHTDVENNTKWKSRIANFTLKSDFTFFNNADNVIKFGAAINGYNFNPGNLTSDNTTIQPPLVSVRNSFEAVLYGNHEVKISDKIGLSYGLRITSWTNQGGAFEFVYDQERNPVDTLFFDAGEDYGEYGNLEPRLGISYFINQNSAIKFSYARNVQNVHLISNSISPFTSLEVWLPSSLNIKPETADQIAAGYVKSFPKSGLDFGVEGYLKKMKNQIDYEAHAETLLNPQIDGELRFGEADASGLELSLKKEQGRIRGWIAYTISRVRRTFEEINNGEPYNAFYDRPHEVNLVLGYDATSRINLGLNWVYYTGSPYSSPIGFYKFNGLETPIYGEKNNSRLPDYHRLDLSATFKLNKNSESKFKHDISLSLYNVYGRKNTLFVNYNKTENEEGEFTIPANLLSDSRVTTQSYLFRFTPSISYNFRFL